jgi:hypothetical protein
MSRAAQFAEDLFDGVARTAPAHWTQTGQGMTISACRKKATYPRLKPLTGN